MKSQLLGSETDKEKWLYGWLSKGAGDSYNELVNCGQKQTNKQETELLETNGGRNESLKVTNHGPDL